MPGSLPVVWVFAGPNGAGKSTVVARYLRGRLPVINPDDIAATLGVGAVDAGRRALQERAELIRQRESFAIETTLSGRNPIGFLSSALERGYRVNLVFVGVDLAETSIARVAHRVRMGQHDVPVEDIVRRFDRSLANLPIAMRIAHRTLVVDNTGRRLRLVLVRQFNRTRLVVKTLPKWVATAVPEDLR